MSALVSLVLAMLPFQSAGSGRTAVKGVAIELDWRYVHKVIESMSELPPRSCGLLCTNEVDALRGQLDDAQKAAAEVPNRAKVVWRPFFSDSSRLGEPCACDAPVARCGIRKYRNGHKGIDSLNFSVSDVVSRSILIHRAKNPQEKDSLS